MKRFKRCGEICWNMLNSYKGWDHSFEIKWEQMYVYSYKMRTLGFREIKFIWMKVKFQHKYSLKWIKVKAR